MELIGGGLVLEASLLKYNTPPTTVYIRPLIASSVLINRIHDSRISGSLSRNENSAANVIKHKIGNSATSGVIANLTAVVGGGVLVFVAPPPVDRIIDGGDKSASVILSFSIQGV